MAGVPFSGDEESYVARAKDIADFLLRHRLSASELQAKVVGYGWFMPGVSLALAPLYLLCELPEIATVRLYAALLMFLLWQWTRREARRVIGPAFSIALFVFPTLSITWLLFSATVWGDAAGGLFLTLACLRVYRMAVPCSPEQPDGYRQILALELLMGVMVYLRGSLLLAAAGLHGLLALLWAYGPRGTRGRRLGRLSLGVVTLLVILAPWSVSASRVLGSPVLTTSSIYLNFGLTFGDPGQLCFGPCAPGNPYFTGAKFSRERARATGMSELHVQYSMAKSALGGLTFAGYARRVAAKFATYLTNPAGFTERFLRLSRYQLDTARTRALGSAIRIATLLLYLPFLLLFAMANFWVSRRCRGDQTLSLLLKLATLCLLAQPFVHPSGSRYWVSYAPFMGLAGGFVVQQAVERWRTAAAGPPGRPGQPRATGQRGKGVPDLDVDAGHLRRARLLDLPRARRERAPGSSKGVSPWGLWVRLD